MMSLTVIAILLALGWLVRAAWRMAVRVLASAPIHVVEGQPVAH